MVTSTVACHSALSSPTSSHVPSFVRVSAEIRNKVYDYLCHSTDPIRLYFYQDATSNKTKPVVPFASNTSIPTAFFSTCRQVNAEASSAFYSSNTFLLNRQTKFAFFIRPCFMGTLLKFLDIVGSRASLVRNVAFDTLTPCNVTDIIEVTALLRQAWDRELSFKIHFIDVRDVEEDGSQYFIENPNLVGATTVIAIVQSLLDGELGLKKYGDLVCGVAVKHDGSGGLISWGSTPRVSDATCWPYYHPHTVARFAAKDGGTRLELAA
ncbi:hypothetical protein Ptr902_08076 [Pyrenophora tritici-repentis]|nr:hypothetical protein Ptr902_08076 [Pyrenophora tritici-repentis]